MGLKWEAVHVVVVATAPAAMAVGAAAGGAEALAALEARRVAAMAVVAGR